MANLRTQILKGVFEKGVESIARYKDLYKILGLTGALGGTMAVAEPSETEAFPIGKVINIGTKMAKTVLKEVPSRTSKYLQGTEFMGQRIKQITKGQGNWRHVVLEDGTVYPVTKDVASDLVRHRETISKMTEFELKKPSTATRMKSVNPLSTSRGQVDQAFKSLEYHERRSNPFLPQRTIIENYKDYVGQVKQTGLGEAVPYSLVKRGNRIFTMPSDYADLLEKEGHLKVIKRLK